jgi:predicted nucleic acid-binding protein
MVRVVLETSVLVAAFITASGTTGAELDAALSGALALCLSPQILEEAQGSPLE